MRNHPAMDPLRVIQIGDDLGVAFPTEMVAQLGVEAGDLLQVHASTGAITLTSLDIAVGREFMSDYRETFRRLAE